MLTGIEQTNRHDFLYWEFHERGFQQAARAGDWKAVRSQADEKENVAEKNPEMVAKFEKYLKTARAESPRWPMKKPVQKTDAKKSG